VGAASDRSRTLHRGTLDELAALGPDRLRGVVTAFLDAVPHRLAELRAAVERQDLPAVRVLAHGVRGSAGAAALVDALSRLEDGDGADAAELVAAVESELARVTSALRDVLTG
jgi:HPt (histidine-containing phosphotransfer) domain-containing protein